jgi:peroxiredoxin Q/BCP
MSKLEVGDEAPLFTAKDQSGNEISLKKLRGKKVILYFYPKDDTPGCTAESCDFRDNYSSLLEKGFEVVGVSADSQKSHQKFIEKFQLPFPLISDTEKDVLNLYSVWGEKKFMGRTYEGILRTTFVIDENGIILERIDKVKTKEPTKQVLDLIK